MFISCSGSWLDLFLLYCTIHENKCNLPKFQFKFSAWLVSLGFVFGQQCSNIKYLYCLYCKKGPILSTKNKFRQPHYIINKVWQNKNVSTDILVIFFIILWLLSGIIVWNINILLPRAMKENPWLSLFTPSTILYANELAPVWPESKSKQPTT